MLLTFWMVVRQSGIRKQPDEVDESESDARGFLMALQKRVLGYGGIIILFLMIGLLMSMSYSRVGTWLSNSQARPIVLAGDSDCNPLNKPCTVQGEDIAITLQLKGQVQPLQAFYFEVDVEGPNAVSAEEISIRFDMKDMSMGFNRFEAVRQSGNIWRGQAILPVCTQRRQDWQMTVFVVGNSRPYAGMFSLMVDR